MSNIKSLVISGAVPFNLTEHHDMNKFLGQLNSPTIGLKITYGTKTTARPNQYGGKTTYYQFSIGGQEAVSTKWVEKLLQALVNCGAEINKLLLVDIENNQVISLKIPEKTEGEFVCDLRVFVQETNKPFDTFDLRRWLEKTLVVDYNSEDYGAFCPPGSKKEAAVSLSAVLETLTPA